MKKNEIKKVLIIRLGAIGDVVHTSNVYRSIKKWYPSIEIHYLTMINPNMLAYDECISKVWKITLDQLKPFSKASKEFAKELRNEKYDVVINLQPSVKTRLIAYLAGIKKRINYHKKDKLHAVQNYWQTTKRIFPEVQELPDLELNLNPEICQNVETQVADFKRPLVILNAGHVFARRQGRTYPIAKWIELGNRIQEKYDGTILITGVKEDEEILKPLESIKNSVSFVSKQTLEENCALIKASDLLISGDSGPLHIATALGTKVIGLYGSMPTSRTGPYGENHCAIVSKKSCVPCNRRKCKYLDFPKELYSPCMCEITVDEIFEKVVEILN